MIELLHVIEFFCGVPLGALKDLTSIRVAVVVLCTLELALTFELTIAEEQFWLICCSI